MKALNGGYTVDLCRLQDDMPSDRGARPSIQTYEVSGGQVTYQPRTYEQLLDLQEEIEEAAKKTSGR